ncbi:SBBP repeat-containing protein [Roseofilum casamattae]|uniref:SBBP repeat-containing protein n=1 Tax=Roseofilum casamattae BLCC-M143 TaxID=3022442 RepID=A0ABT7C280_9CYAN|nr:SBBP repeat-containing protein [Roseofilum casamattae]MDJ1185390.1 SBBP repeat-containing protein [Roseofilum casamattae BLCC-M143]
MKTFPNTLQIFIPVQFSSAPELVVIDSGVDTPEHLLQGLQPNTVVKLLDSNQDGVVQITQILQEVRARRIHIVSHGSPGCLYLGNTRLNLHTLKHYQEAIATWNIPLLLYGCRVAATETGQNFVQQLEKITGTTVKASTQRVGNAAKGGTWNLDWFVPWLPDIVISYPGVFDPQKSWIKSFGSSGSDNGKNINTDSNGNVYTIGSFQGSIDLDGDGTADLTSLGHSDAYIAKYNSDGSLTWLTQIGGIGGDYGTTISTDPQGNIYATGFSLGRIDFDGDGRADFWTTDRSSDSYIAKYGSDGSLTWVNHLSGASTNLNTHIVTDSNNNFYTSGFFYGTIDLDGDRTPNFTSRGLADGYIAKYNSDNSLAWSTQFGGTGNDQNLGLDVDSNGNVYVTGFFKETIDLDGDGVIDLTSLGSDDAYIAKYSNDGILTWVKSFGNSGSDKANSIVIDNNDNSLLTGSFQGSLDLDGDGTVDLTSTGGFDSYIVKYSDDGSLLWATQIGGNGHDYGDDITTDDNSNVYITGNFTGSIDVEGDDITDITSTGESDAYIAKYDSNGTLDWVTQVGGIDLDYGYDITTDHNGDVFVTGSFREEVDLNGDGIADLTGGGGSDVYIIKLRGDSGEFLSGNGVINQAPTIISNSTVSIVENRTDVIAVSARDANDDSLSYFITGGSDRSFFNIDSISGELTFNITPSYQTPADTNGDNIYELEVTVDDGNGGTSTQDLSITVRDKDAKPLTVQQMIGFQHISGPNRTEGHSISIDSSGNVYTTGDFYDSVDLDADGTTDLTGGGMYIAKYATDGTLTWANRVSSSNPDNGKSISTDSNGSVYLTSHFRGTIDLNGDGTPDFTSQGDSDAYIAKYSSDGNLAWATQVGGSSRDEGYGITTDNADNVYATGSFYESLDLDGDGTTDLTSNGINDAYIAKYSSDGNLAWAKNFGGNSGDYGYDIHADNNGNIYTTGFFRGSIDLDGDGTTDLNSTGNDAYIVKYTSDGTLAWATQIQTNASIDMVTMERGQGITTDSDGNVYATLFFVGDIDVDGDGTTDLTSAGGSDAYTAKYSPDGTLVWAKAFGGSGYERNYSIAADNTGNIYTVGSFSETIDIDKDGTADLATTAYEDAYIAKYSSDGTLAGVTQIVSDRSTGLDISVDSSGDIYATGSFHGNLDVDRDGVNDFTSLGYDDAYIIKFSGDGSSNQAPSIISSASTSIVENTTDVLTVSATDGDDDSLSYSISGGDDQSLFDIDTLSGALTFTVAPDYETPADADGNNVYQLEVTVDDGNGGTDVQALSITVTDEDEVVPNQAPAITSSNSANVAENTTDVLTVSATDGDDDSLSYSISGGDDQSLFDIDTLSGALTFTVAPDYETPTDADGNNVYQLEVTVDDGNGGTDVQALSITVTDEDEVISNQAPSITSSNNANVAENTTDVLTVSATDAEDDSLSYSISGGDDQSLFDIDTLSGALTFTVAPDYEAPADADGDNVYQLEVTVDDGNGGTDVQALSITVTDEDEVVPNQAPTITSSNSANVAENTTDVLTVSATDAEDDSLSYSISGGDDQSLFDIDTLSGALTFTVAPDYETPADADGNNVYQLEVTVDDGNGGTDVQALSITVTDEDEVVPNQAPTITSSNSANIAENTTDVLTVSATDGDDDSLSYSISGGDDQSLFDIDTLSGALTFTVAPDYETPVDADGDNVYQLEVTVNDGNGGTDAQSLSITVTDRDDTPPSNNLNPIAGTPGNDWFLGTNSDDEMRGFDGDDELYGRFGDDIITGDSGNDLLSGNQGHDRISGGIGNDTIFGGQHHDEVNGDEGDDSLMGDRGKDTVNGGIGNDTVFGGRGDDALNGDEGDDSLMGDLNEDTLAGGSGNDSLFGGNGDDLLEGGEGNDLLSGDWGKDTLLGGNGNDLFVLRAGTAADRLAKADIVQDYQVGSDRIGLTGNLTTADLTLSIQGNNTVIGIANTDQILGMLVGQFTLEQLTFTSVELPNGLI